MVIHHQKMAVLLHLNFELEHEVKDVHVWMTFGDKGINLLNLVLEFWRE